MSTGKYSPTVSAAYSKDQNWHTKHSGLDEWYDLDGYDSYGYDSAGVDRAGYNENEYMFGETDNTSLWNDVMFEWTFDGTRPVRRK